MGLPSHIINRVGQHPRSKKQKLWQKEYHA